MISPRRVTATALLLALAGCSNGSEAPEEGRVEGGPAVRGGSSSAPSPDDPFYVHPRFLRILEAAGAQEDPSYRPGATEWGPPPRRLPTLATENASSPDALLEAFAEAWSRGEEAASEEGPETLTRLRDVTDTSATGAVLRHGYLDDSVAGEAWHLELRKTSGGWIVADAAHRWFCWRGVSSGRCS